MVENNPIMTIRRKMTVRRREEEGEEEEKKKMKKEKDKGEDNFDWLIDVYSFDLT